MLTCIMTLLTFTHARNLESLKRHHDLINYDGPNPIDYFPQIDPRRRKFVKIPDDKTDSG